MQAMILAAGFGTRLGEASKTTPKCLFEANGKTMLERVAQRLIAFGVTRLVINLHHLGDQIEQYVHQQQDFGIEVFFSEEKGQVLGTGGGILAARKFLEDGGDFYVHNGDVYSEIDLADLMKSHKDKNPLATLAVMDRDTSRYLLFDSGQRLVGWKNTKDKKRHVVAECESTTQKGFSGIHVISSSIFSELEKESDEFFSIITTYLSATKTGSSVQAYDVGNAYWKDMGTPEQLMELEQFLSTKESK